jgi:oligopeptide transport system ATP-binding protein
MYLGKLVELADQQTLYRRPLHPYTQALLSAVPIPDPALEAKRQRIVLTGDVPNPATPPRAAHSTRCPMAEAIVGRHRHPNFWQVEPGHHVACHAVN